MAPSFASSWRSFWHTMTSYDRHATHDSPYRTGQHVPLPQSRHAPLTSIATSAIESRHDLASPYAQDDPATSSSYIGSPIAPASPRSPYAPGMRSNSMNRSQTFGESANAATQSVSKSNVGIQMQDFSDGLPPPPPVAHSWERINRWAEQKYEELFDNLCDGCTQNDVNELEHELDCTLPLDVRESLQVHDGQERGGLPTGIIFGSMLLDCEEIVEEWQNWRRVNQDLLQKTKPKSTIFRSTPQPPGKAFGGVEASSSSSPPPPEGTQSPNQHWREDLLARQASQPPNAVQKAYSHPGWIPLVRDWGGNYLAVDLAPAPSGRWGQVITFGRDYDCKYVIARSWAHFLAQFADDLSSEHVSVDEETGELKLRLFKQQNVDPPYFEILRWRTDQKCGRRTPKRRASGPTSGQNGLHVNSNVGGTGMGSPYGSPTTEDRGRSPSRFPPRGPGSGTNSPRSGTLVSSPLARVAEETPAPVRVHTNLAYEEKANGQPNSGKLVSIDSPSVSTNDFGLGVKSPDPKLQSSDEANKENQVADGKGKGHSKAEELKEVAI